MEFLLFFKGSNNRNSSQKQKLQTMVKSDVSYEAGSSNNEEYFSVFTNYLVTGNKIQNLNGYKNIRKVLKVGPRLHIGRHVLTLFVLFCLASCPRDDSPCVH